MEKKIIVFESYGKFYFTSADNYYVQISNINKITEMTGFNNLEECKDFLEKNYECEVKIAN